MLLLIGERFGHGGSLLLMVETILVPDEAEVRHDWRVETHFCLLEPLGCLSQVSHHVLVCADEGTVEGIAWALPHDILFQLNKRSLC